MNDRNWCSYDECRFELGHEDVGFVIRECNIEEDPGYSGSGEEIILCEC